MLNFKSVLIRDGGLDYVTKNDGNEGVQLVMDTKNEYPNSNWDLIFDKNGYSLRSPTTFKRYPGPFTLKRQYKDAQNKLIIRTGNNNRSSFSIDFSSRESLFETYKCIKDASGIKKIIMIFKLLEQQHLLQKSNRQAKALLKKL